MAAKRTSPRRRKTIASEYNLLVRKIPMRDGVRLHTRIYLPRETGRHNVILQRTPYDKDSVLKAPEESYFRADAVFIHQSCRGTGMSDGVFYPWQNEADDTEDTIRWIAGQKWFSGRLTLDGASYGGWLQWGAAARAPEALVGFTPAFAPADLYADVYPGGALLLHLYSGWGMSMHCAANLSNEHIPNWERLRLAENLPLKDIDLAATGEAVPFWRDWIENPRRNAYWAQFDVDWERIAAPAYIVGGWFDHYCNPALENFTAMRERAGDPQARAFTRCLIGPWTHTGLANPELFGKETTPEAVAADRALRFKEGLMENPAVDPLPDEAPVTYYMLGAKEWRTAQTWPPENSAEEKYYLHSSGCANSVLGNGDLNLAPPADEQFDTCIYNPFQPVPTTGGGFLGGGKNGCLDQSELEKRLDILVFTSAPLDKDLEIAGRVRVVLWASSSAPDTDFCAKLVDVAPDGTALNLCDGIIRARFRNSDKVEELLEGGEICRYLIDCRHTANCFRAGHRLRLELSHSNFPRFDRNPNTGAKFGDNALMNLAKQVVYHDAARPSHLILPVLRQSLATL
ncbi:CocE/NonD family hydrolase [Desulfovibrio porci]|uniref:CocE/NonD family hydrolase n=1 Tax=Desulfovibrio porci TaxID=2605782 RepID=UPI003A907E7C